MAYQSEAFGSVTGRSTIITVENGCIGGFNFKGELGQSLVDAYKTGELTDAMLNGLQQSIDPNHGASQNYFTAARWGLELMSWAQNEHPSGPALRRFLNQESIIPGTEGQLPAYNRGIAPNQIEALLDNRYHVHFIRGRMNVTVVESTRPIGAETSRFAPSVPAQATENLLSRRREIRADGADSDNGEGSNVSSVADPAPASTTTQSNMILESDDSQNHARETADNRPGFDFDAGFSRESVVAPNETVADIAAAEADSNHNSTSSSRTPPHAAQVENLEEPASHPLDTLQTNSIPESSPTLQLQEADTNPSPIDAGQNLSPKSSSSTESSDQDDPSRPLSATARAAASTWSLSRAPALLAHHSRWTDCQAIGLFVTISLFTAAAPLIYMAMACPKPEEQENLAVTLLVNLLSAFVPPALVLGLTTLCFPGLLAQVADSLCCTKLRSHPGETGPVVHHTGEAPARYSRARGFPIGSPTIMQVANPTHKPDHTRRSSVRDVVGPPPFGFRNPADNSDARGIKNSIRPSHHASMRALFAGSLPPETDNTGGIQMTQPRRGHRGSGSTLPLMSLALVTQTNTNQSTLDTTDSTTLDTNV